MTRANACYDARESVSGDGLPSDPSPRASGSPPAAAQSVFGRFRLLDRLATGRLGSLFRGEDLTTGDPVVIKRLDIRVGPERTRQLADDLETLAQRLPEPSHTARVLAGGLDGDQLTLVMTLVPGEGLDVALRAYGPAALVDAVPRLDLVAGVLDRAAARGIWHGALSPRDVIVSATDTHLTGLGVAQILDAARVPIEPRSPYSAPEGVGDGLRASRADQFALAAIAHEWVLGVAIAGPAHTAVAVPSLAGVDHERLADAFTTALAPDPEERFPNCGAFVAALRVAARLEDAPAVVAVSPAHPDAPSGQLRFDDALLHPIDPDATAVVFKNTATDTIKNTTTDTAPESTVAWRGGLTASEMPRPASEGTSYGTLAAAFVVGILLGAAGGYLLAERGSSTADQSDQSAVAGSGDAATTPSSGAGAAPPQQLTEMPVRPAPEPPEATARGASPAAAASPGVGRVAPASAGARLLVRSSPAGASVSVDGTARGTTPLTLRDLEIGARTIRLQRAGYQPVERRVVLSADRPSRSIDVTLVPVMRATAPLRQPPAATGSLLVESRPPGARVTIDGKEAGATPLTVASITPGRHTVLIAAPGWAPVTSTVDVKAGARARVAVTLERGRQDE